MLPAARRDEEPFMQQPPLLPRETLLRVLRLAKLDGSTILIISGAFALLHAMGGDVSGAMVGLLVAGAGAIELHGVGQLHEGEPRGMDWLVASQLVLLFSILAYCAVKLAQVDIPPVPDALAPMIDASAERLDMTRDEYLRFIQRLSIQIVAGISILYQGGMALYYHRRRLQVRKALQEMAEDSLGGM